MTILEKLKDIDSQLTKSEKIIAQYIMDNPIDIVRYGTSEIISQSTNCSRASLIRLTKKLGYSGFSDFKKDFYNEIIGNLDTNESILDYYSTALLQLKSLYSTKVFNDIVALLKNSSYVYTTGYAHSNYSALQFAFRLNRNYIASSCIDSALGLTSTVGIKKDNTCLVIFSISGGNYDNSFLESLKEFKNNNTTKTVLITMSDNTTYEKYCDYTLRLPCVSRMCNTSIIDDAPVFFSAIEMLIEKIVEK